MKRFITYLYDYAGGTKGKSAGFVRVDVRGREVRMEIHVRDVNRFQGKGKIYFIAKNDKVLGIFAGEITIVNGNGDERLRFSNINVNGSGMDFSNVIGMVIRCENGHLASNWAEENCPELVRGTFEIFSNQNRAKEVLPESEAVAEVVEVQTSGSVVEEMEIQESGLAEDVVEPKESGLVENVMEPKESVTVEGVVELQERKSLADIVGNREKVSIAEITGPSISEHVSNIMTPEPTYRKIQLAHIRDLPAKNWHLCNNSFLLHGFFNYNYLILKKEQAKKEEVWSLGVPGVYEQPERMMAIMFGFPEFEAQEKEIKEPKEGTFGAWFINLEV